MLKIFKFVFVLVGVILFSALIVVMSHVLKNDKEGEDYFSEDSIPDFTENSIGLYDAGVIFVESCDFASEECGALARSLKNLSAEYPTEVKVIFKHFPDTTDTNSAIASQATPVLLLNGTIIDATGGYGSLRQMVDNELARLEEVANATINAGSDDDGNVGASFDE
jgi:hypothetical protein